MVTDSKQLTHADYRFEGSYLSLVSISHVRRLLITSRIPLLPNADWSPWSPLGSTLTPPLTQPENILLHSPGPYPHIQIADFGLARPRAYEETLHVCGTISYLPPEGVRALENKHLGYVGMPADCWSAGIVIFAMLTYAISFESISMTLTLITRAAFLELMYEL